MCTPLHRGLSKKCGFTPIFFQLFLSGKLVLNHGVDCVSLFIRRARKARNKEVVLGHQQSLSGRIRVLPPHPLRRSLPTTCRRIGSPCQCMINYVTICFDSKMAKTKRQTNKNQQHVYVCKSAN